MGLVCNLIVQPIIRLIEIFVAVVEFILVAICRIIEELVSIVKQVLRYICQNVVRTCLLYTSPSPRDRQKSRMPSSA